MSKLVIDGAKSAAANLILAHGAGAGSESQFMETMATNIAEQGVNVIRFDFPYMQVSKELNKRRPPDRMPKLIKAFVKVIQQCCNELPLFIGGKSMGGRVATMVASEAESHCVSIAGVIALGYPFHPPGKPDNTRIDHLQEEYNKPSLILQGQRDAFGKEKEVLQYSLNKNIQLTFIEDGDHSFKPRKSANVTEQQNLLFASQQVVSFINQISQASSIEK